MTDIFYYIARKDHQPGELLGGGNFGRGYRQYPYDINTPLGAFNGWKVAKEMIFESIRVKHYPSLPSHFECSFAYVAREDALKGFESERGLFAFEVQLVSLNTPSHIGDFTILSSTNNPDISEPFIPWVEANAHLYWAGFSPRVPELLALSPLRVVRRIA